MFNALKVEDKILCPLSCSLADYIAISKRNTWREP